MKKKNIFKTILLCAGLFATVSAGAQTFPQFEKVTPAGSPQVFRGNAVWGDYNNDGRMDLISVGRDITNGWKFDITLFTNNGTGFDLNKSAILPVNSDGTDYNSVFTWIDYNNDGFLDLLYMGTLIDDNVSGDDNYASRNLFVKLYRNTGTGNFTEVTGHGINPVLIDQEGCYAAGVTVGDYNNDGYQDILMTGRRDALRVVWLYKNNGNGTFSLQETPNGGTKNFDQQSSGSVTFADFNNDGYLDIIVNGYDPVTQDGIVRMYLNNGDGTFRDNLVQYDISKESTKGQIGVADLNNDGYLDFVLTGERAEGNWQKVIAVYLYKENDGDYLLYEEIPANIAQLDNMQKGSVDFADFNNDGQLDIFMTGEIGDARSTVFMKNAGNMTYEASLNGICGYARSGSIGSLVDFNNDGYLDAATMGYDHSVPYIDNGEPKTGASAFNIYKNLGNFPVNTAPTAPGNLKVTYAGGKAAFTWDAGSDAETPAAALRYNIYVKKANGEIFTLIPADIATGYIKTSIITPALTTTSYVMNIAEADVDGWGVQTIDQNKKGSAFIGDPSSVKTTGISKPAAYIQDNNIVVVSEEAAAVSVYDVTGKLIASASNITNGVVANVTQGVYLVKIQVGNELIIKKLEK